MATTVCSLLVWGLTTEWQTPGCLQRLSAPLPHADVGAAGAMASAFGANGCDQPVYVDTPTPLLAWKLSGVNGSADVAGILRARRAGVAGLDDAHWAAVHSSQHNGASSIASSDSIRAHAPAANGSQTAYRVVASTSADRFARGIYDAWDSGMQTSGATRVRYAGNHSSTLGDTVYWTVIVYDGSGAACPSASPQVFTSALGAPWQTTTWLVRDTAPPVDECSQYVDAPTPLLRTEFPLRPSPIASAHLLIAVAGVFSAYVNGVRIGDCMFCPGWTNVSVHTRALAYNVMTLLQPGASNVLGIELGNGWYNPLPMRLFGSFNLRNVLPVGPPAAAAILLITYADGSTSTVTTSADGTWRVGNGGTLRNNVYLGTKYDARQADAVAGWTMPDFNVSSWPSAKASNATNLGAPQLQAAPSVRVTQVYRPVSITTLPGSPPSYVVQFPVNMAGVVAILDVPTGSQSSTTNFTFAEILMSNGSVNTVTNLAGAIGHGQESYTPSYTWHAFQYMQIDNWPSASPPTADNFVALQFNVDNQEAGVFDAWNPQLVAIDGIVKQSFRSNWAGGIQSDCPGRERLGYGGDLLAAAPAAVMQFDVAQFYAKRTTDYAEAVRSNGGFPETAPYMGINTCDSLQPLAGAGPMQWGAAHAWLQRYLYTYYGDTRVIEDNFPLTIRWMQLLQDNLNAKGLLVNGLADFTQPYSVCNAGALGVMGTAFMVNQAQLAAELAGILGDATLEAQFKALAASVQASFVDAFVASNGTVGDGRLDETAWALFYGLVPDPIAPLAVQRLVDAIRANGTHMYSGAFATSFIFQGAAAWGIADVIYEVLAQVDYPGYGFMLANNATTVWEHWDNLWAKNSFNHAWLGSVAAFLRQTVGGIRAQDGAVGMDSILIAPQPVSLNSSAARWQAPGRAPSLTLDDALAASLPYASLSYLSAAGNISAAWWYEQPASGGTALHVLVDVPANVRVRVELPLPAGVTNSTWAACAAAAPTHVRTPTADVYTLDFMPGLCEMLVAW